MKDIVTMLSFKNYLTLEAMVLYPQSLRYSGSLFTILSFKYKCLGIISCERQLLYAYNKKSNIHKIIFLLVEKAFCLNKNNF